MALFKVGDRISLVENVNKKGEIEFVHSVSSGIQHYDIVFDDNHVSSKAEHEITHEVRTLSPWSIFASGYLLDFDNFYVANTIHKIRNTSANTLSTLKASRTVFKPYQYLPLVKLLRSDNRRILIADEVGLGKTIEAGHILLELLSRGEVQNLLVICSNSLKEKWRSELSHKFNINCKIHSSTRELINDIDQDLSNNQRRLFAITNYEKFSTVNPNTNANALLEHLEKTGYHFDLIVCDEAHKLRNKNNTSDHIRRVVQNARSLVFMTATPIMTSLENLYNLLSIIEPRAYNNYEVFYNNIESNKPFIKAIEQLNKNVSFKEIADALRSHKLKVFTRTDGQIVESRTDTMDVGFGSDEAVKKLFQNLERLDDTPSNRVLLQRQLLELNTLNYVYTRTRKKDVLEEVDLVNRDVKTIEVELTPEESAMYKEMIESYDSDFSLGLITKKRQISSSIVAFHSERSELQQGVYNTGIPDSKFEHLRAVIETNRKSGTKLIIFAFFTNTLLYLSQKLKELNIGAELIYGQSENRDASIERFKTDPNITVLLSSEVGSEGLDLQFCKALVNYDLPWNPMVVEQRIGRIDRIGQKNRVVNIFNFVLKGTIEEKIYNRLFKRIKLFESSLGAMEEILGELEDGRNFIQKGIEEIYRDRLTDSEIEERLSRMLLAFEREKVNLETISFELSDTLTNDAYFKNEIAKIESNKRYLTGHEIQKLLQRFLKDECPTLHFTQSIDNVWSISGSSQEIQRLFNKIKNDLDDVYRNPEVHKMFSSFLVKHQEASNIVLTFDQKVAFEDSSIEFFSAFHPFVNAIANYYCRQQLEKNQANQLNVSVDKARTIGLEGGIYILVSFNLLIDSYINESKTKSITELRFICLDLNRDEIYFLSEEQTDSLTGLLVSDSEIYDREFELDFEGLTELIRTPVMTKIKEIEIDVQDFEASVLQSKLSRKIKSETEYLYNRINRNAEMLRDKRGIEQILKSEISNDQRKIEELNLQLGSSKLKVTHSLVSINLIQVK